MPIKGPASYPPTTEAFLSHWLEVNDALDDPVLTLPGEPLGYAAPVTRGQLETLRTSLEASRAAVQDELVELGLSRAGLEDAKKALLARLNQFNDKVRGLLPGTKWERVLPLVPSLGDVRSKFLDPMEDVAALWGKIHAVAVLQPAGAALTLLGGYTLAMFTAAVTALHATYRAHGDAEQKLRLAREERNDLQDEIYPIHKQYRALMPTFFESGDALVETLPLLSPLAGHTPEAVAATGSWDAAAGQGKIEWGASEEADLEHYEVRWCPGEEYQTDDESMLESVAPGAPRSVLTAQGLGTAGATALFRVYVVLGTGNEKGSATVSITRPGP